MPNKSIFITGTDTDVGKTVATAAIAQYYLAQNKKVCVVKAIQTGDIYDVDFLIEHTEINKDDTFTILKYKYPLAPQQAAEKEKVAYPNVDQLIKKIKDISNNYDITLVEGSGGLYVPIKPNYMMLDLIKDLKVAVVVASRIGLGTINHTTLTLKTLQQNQIDVLGVVYNTPLVPGADVSVSLNPDVISEITSEKTLGILPYQDKFDISELAKYLHLEDL